MTVTVPPPVQPAAPTRPTVTGAPRSGRPPEPAPAPAMPPRRIAALAAAWVGVALVSIVIVLYALTPSFAEREQRHLLESYRVELAQSANEALTIEGATAPTRSPELGAPVGVLEVGGLQLQQVVVEGATTAQTAAGPGHVPGTAGLGQAGNAVVVGRQTLFGGPFGDIGAMHRGDRILVTTEQGQTVYTVDRIGAHTIDDASAAAAATGDLYGSTEEVKDPLDGPVVNADVLYGPSPDDRLTLVTSDSVWPLNRSHANVVVAKLEGRPFPPTLQNGRSSAQDGRSADATAWAPLVLAILFYALAAVMAVTFYRRTSPRVAYLLTVAPILVATIVIAETVSRVLPAWT